MVGEVLLRRCAFSASATYNTEMLRHITIAAILIVSLVVLAFAGTYHNTPDPNSSGGLTGIIEPAEGLQTVVAVEPTANTAYEAQVDATTGKFSFDGLPAGEYDLLIKTVGNVYEGITLATEDDELLKGKELLKLRDEVAKAFFITEDYFNIKKISRMTGNAGKARMFVVQVRTRPVVDPLGNLIHANIRRFDLVEMTNSRKAWQTTNSRHLLRQEVPFNDPDNVIQIHYSPDLSKILIGESVKDLGILKLKKLKKGDLEGYPSADYTAK